MLQSSALEPTTQVLVSTPIPQVTEDLLAAFREELAARGKALEIQVVASRRGDGAARRAEALVYPAGVVYHVPNEEDAREIAREHLVGGEPVERLIGERLGGEELERVMAEHAFHKHQEKIALRRCGVINPESIDDYLAMDGYKALEKALREMTPEQVVETMLYSELRGRGGAGFPTGTKWKIAAEEQSEKKYVVCNADEGDPGAFMDRSLLELDPHAIIEAMAICGYAIGADQGYIYVRAEYPLAIERLSRALHQARERRFIGWDILGKGFRFDLEIRIGAGAFVCGEETALMRSIEGKRGSPRVKPPFPVTKGLFGKPTVLNNVETFANVGPIVLAGAESFQKHGKDRSRGTKVFALAGHVNNSGLVEVPMGITLGEIVHDLGGGVPQGKRFKAAQIGGPSGGCIPAQHLNTPLTYESLPSLSAIMGSGGLVIINEDTCMVDLARYFLEFIQDESCGKCTPCRIGTKIMLDLVTKITKGEGTLEDLDALENIAPHIASSSLCGLGQTAPNPVLSTLRYFRHEYLEHIEKKRCRAGSCGDLIHAPCSNACPASVNVPAYLAYGAEDRWEEALTVHLRNNPFPSVCGRVCPQWCIQRCRRSAMEGPLAVRAVKRFLGDLAEDYTRYFPKKAEPNGHRVAVVGGGPGGLTCAYYLVLLGYEVTVFEKQDEAGGMMRYAIPEYRLPREILAKEIRSLEEFGVEIRTGVTIGKDETIASLTEQGFESVFVATGAGKALVPRGTPGIDLPGVLTGIDFLERTSKGEDVKLGKRVMIVGGGDVAIDCSRVARRYGAEAITVVYRRTREEMPTSPIEIAEAEVEGVKVELLANVTKIDQAPDGGLRATVIHNRLGEFDKSGRRRPEPIEDSEEQLVVDNVILAIGQESEIEEIVAGTELEGASRWLEADEETGRTKAPRIFAGGDLVSGSATVIEAIAAGQRAAKSIDQALRPGKRDYFWERLELPQVDPDLEKEMIFDPPVKYPMLSADERFVTIEVEKTISRQEACHEASRCLRCDFKGHP